MTKPDTYSKVAIISDTHGLLRPTLFNQLIGVDLIIHAGDICDDAILEQLQYVAPVQAVRGNMDRSGACRDLPATASFQLGKYKVYLIHDINVSVK